ncbi:uncharacterized protein [Haliotis asinina]|uniref:uncharacterized protein n=1 Tax=Haliotis asinina TaxID=109174 RepID=UPI003531E8B8
MELTTSSVILFQCIVVFCHGINPTTILNLGGSYDNILSAHSYELLKVKTLEHCHRVCLYSPKCLSVNWNVKTKYCQLNSEDVGTGTDLMMSTGNLYVPALSANIQDHACVPSPCQYGEVCIPAMATTSFVCLRPKNGTGTSTAFPTTVSATTAITTTTSTTTTTTTTPTTTTTITTTTTPTSTTITTTTTPTTTTTITTTTTPTTTTATPTTTTTITTTTTPTTTTTITTTTTPTTTTTITTTTTPTTTTTTTTTTTSTTTTTPKTTEDLYSDSFLRIQGYVVWLLNNKTYTGVSSVSTCEQYCVQYTVFLCKSYEYYYAQRWCFLQSFVKDDALSVWTADSRGDYFQRLRFSELSATTPS